VEWVVLAHSSGEITHKPSPLDPPDHLPTQSEGVGGIQQPFMCPLEHFFLIDQVVQDCPPLSKEVVQSVFGVLDEAMFV